MVDNGFAGQAWWTKAAGDVLIVAVADGQLVSVLAGMSLTTVGAGYGLAAVVRAARRAAPVTITITVAVVASAYLLARRYPAGRVHIALKEFGAFVVTSVGNVKESQQSAAARLPWVKIPAGRPPTLEERCARILARVTGTLSAAELHEQLHRDAGHPVASVPTVRRILADHPAFAQVDEGQWQLGESAGPCHSPDARYGQWSRESTTSRAVRDVRPAHGGLRCELRRPPTGQPAAVLARRRGGAADRCRAAACCCSATRQPPHSAAAQRLRDCG